MPVTPAAPTTRATRPTMVAATMRPVPGARLRGAATVASMIEVLLFVRGEEARALRPAPPEGCLCGGRLGNGNHGGVAVLETRQPAEPARQVPVGVAEQLHRRRQQHCADERCVDEHRGCEADAHLLEVEERERGEDAERTDHDE